MIKTKAKTKNKPKTIVSITTTEANYVRCYGLRRIEKKEKYDTRTHVYATYKKTISQPAMLFKLKKKEKTKNKRKAHEKESKCVST